MAVLLESLPRLPRVIDARAARNEPDEYRRRLARKGAAEAFDALARRRRSAGASSCRASTSSARGTKVKGKPTPEQLEELARRQGGAAARRSRSWPRRRRAGDDVGLRIPNPPADDVPDGATEDDVRVERVVGEPPQLADPKESLELGRFDMERAARMSGARFGYWVGDTGRLALALYRYALDRLADKGFVHDPAAGARARGGDDTARAPSRPTSRTSTGSRRTGSTSRHRRDPARQPSRRRDPRRGRAAAPLRRLLAVLPPRGGRRRQGHARHVPRPPVQQGRAVRAARCPRARGTSTSYLLANTEELVRELGVPYRVVVAAGRRHLGGVGEDVRRRDLVPEPGAIPRDRLGLEHHRLPGPPARHPLPRRQEPRAVAHAQRHRGRRPDGARGPRELPGRGAGRAARVRRAGARHSFSASHSFASRFWARVSHASSTRSRSSSRSSRSRSGMRMSTAE